MLDDFAQEQVVPAKMCLAATFPDLRPIVGMDCVAVCSVHVSIHEAPDTELWTQIFIRVLQMKRPSNRTSNGWDLPSMPYVRHPLILCPQFGLAYW